MNSRAALLLQAELLLLKESPLSGVAIEADEVDPLCWSVVLSGLPGLLYEDAAFQLTVRAPNDFDKSPPTLTFMTIPYHPNVCPHSGNVDAAVVCNLRQWTPGVTLRDVVAGVQALLSRPRLAPREAIRHAAAAETLERDLDAFEALARQCVQAAARVKAGMAPHQNIDATAMAFANAVRPRGSGRRPAVFREYLQKPPKVPPPLRINFEDYHATWRSLGSTKVDVGALRTAATAASNNSTTGDGGSGKRSSSAGGGIITGTKRIGIGSTGAMLADGSTTNRHYQAARAISISVSTNLPSASEASADDLVAWSQGLPAGDGEVF